MHINGIETMLSGTRELTASIVSLEASASGAGAGAGSNLNTPDFAAPSGLGASFAASQKLVRWCAHKRLLLAVLSLLSPSEQFEMDNFLSASISCQNSRNF